MSIDRGCWHDDLADRVELIVRTERERLARRRPDLDPADLAAVEETLRRIADRLLLHRARRVTVDPVAAARLWDAPVRQPAAPATTEAHAPATTEAHAPATTEAHAPATTAARAPTTTEGRAPTTTEGRAPTTTAARRSATTEAGASATTEGRAPIMTAPRARLTRALAPRRAAS